jgi:hypothetical protein
VHCLSNISHLRRSQCRAFATSCLSKNNMIGSKYRLCNRAQMSSLAAHAFETCSYGIFLEHSALLSLRWTYPSQDAALENFTRDSLSKPHRIVISDPAVYLYAQFLL